MAYDSHESVQSIVAHLIEKKFIIKDALRERITSALPRIVLFADLSGSTAIWNENPVPAFLRTLAHHFAHAVASHDLAAGREGGEGGLPRKVVATVVKTVGDEVIITYGFSSSEGTAKTESRDARSWYATDEGLEALAELATRVMEAAVITRDALERREKETGKLKDEEDYRVNTKIGIHVCYRYLNPEESLELVSYPDEYVNWFKNGPPEKTKFFPPGDLLGDDMNLAARVAHSANTGDVIISEALYDLAWSSRNPPASLRASDPLRFQNWKGIVSVSKLVNEADFQIEGRSLNKKRCARVIARSTGEDDAARPRYRWPFHAVALLAKGHPTLTPTLTNVLRHRELESNLIFAAKIEEEHTLRIKEGRSGELNAETISESLASRDEKDRAYFGLIRSCTTGFEVYNDVMRNFIYDKIKTLTYSSPIVMEWEGRSKSTSEDVEDYLKAQPRGIRWGGARAAKKTLFVLFLRTLSFQESQEVLKELKDRFQGRTRDLALLYGEWDVYGVFEGEDDDVWELILESLAAVYFHLRVDPQLECALVFRARELVQSGAVGG